MPENNQKTNTENTPVAVCAAVIIDQGKVLITLRPEGKRFGGFWEFPGGKIEQGESHEQALRRELKEELDIDIDVGSIFKTVHHHYDWGNVLILAYLCRWVGGEICHLEVADHCWVTADQFSDYNILPADKPILEKLESILSCN